MEKKREREEKRKEKSSIRERKQKLRFLGKVALPLAKNNYNYWGCWKRDRKCLPESSDALALVSGASRRQVAVGSWPAYDFA